MESKAVLKYFLVSPRKIRRVTDLVRGYSYHEALDRLYFLSNKSAPVLHKLLCSAYANFKASEKKLNVSTSVEDKNLYIKKIYVDEGPTLKRFRPRARGRGSRRLRPTSHVTLVLGTED